MELTCINKRFYILVVALVFFCSGSVAIAGKSGDTLTFGIVPQQSEEKLFKLWHPIMQYLSKDTGYTVRFATAPTNGEFEKRSVKGEYDIAYMNPYHYVTIAKKAGYRVVVNQSNKRLKGILVVRKDSGINSLADLQGKKIHFPSPVAFGASRLTRAALDKAGVEYTAQYVGSHDSVYLNVVRSLATAGGGVMRTFKVQPAGLSAQLKILAITKTYTPHPIAVHTRVTDKIRKAITASLLTLPRHLLTPLKFNPLHAVADKDYNDVRALGLDKITNK